MREPAFADRPAAGRLLADALATYSGRDDVVIVGLARGGVPVAAPIADRLGAALDVMVVRKLGVPGHEELAMGALASGGVTVRNDEVIAAEGISAAAFDAVVSRERAVLAEREQRYRQGRAAAARAGRVVVLVDDGLATGASMRAAVAAARAQHAAFVVVAVPVGAPSTCRELADLADEIVCLYTPPDFAAVGNCYADFTQTSDAEVQRLLADTVWPS